MALKLLKKLMHFLVFVIIALVVFMIFAKMASHPPWVENERSLYDECNIVIPRAEMHTYEKDDFGRQINYACSKENKNERIYVVTQSFFSKGFGDSIMFKKGRYYYYDREGKGTETEEFKQFLEENDWNNPVETPKEQLYDGHQKENDAMYDFSDNFSRYDKKEKIQRYDEIMKKHGFETGELTSIIADNYYRLQIGFLVPSKEIGKSPKLYALCLHASSEFASYYFADRCVAEIRLDHYAEDPEAFKKSNNWDEPLTVEDLNTMDKYVVSGSAKWVVAVRDMFVATTRRDGAEIYLRFPNKQEFKLQITEE